MSDRILLIDDDQALLRITGRYLTRMGYDVITQDTGKGGVEEFRRSSPDVVLLDFKLPDINGFEVLQEIKPLGATVVMLTGEGDVERAVQAMQLGAENFLTKPVEMAHLVISLERALDKVRLRCQVELLKSRATPDEDLSALGVSNTMQQLSDELKVATCCGNCRNCARRLLREANGRAAMDE